MNITVEKIKDKYYAIVRNFSKSIHKYKIIKSWKRNACVTEIVSRNLIENPIDLYNKGINLLDFSIELEPINNSNDYYTISLITKDGLEYPFYIDINKFYNLQATDKIYFNKFENDEITLESIYHKKYDFYLLGNFGDKHKVKLIEVVDNKNILFKPIDYNKYTSEVYYLVVELNEKIIYKKLYPFFNLSPEFVCDFEDYETYLKYTIVPKYNYPYLKEFSIYHKDKLLNKVVKNNIDEKFKNVIFFLPNLGVNNPIELLIKYKIKENYNGSGLVEKNLLITKNIYSKDKISINDFYSSYDFSKDIYTLRWNNPYLLTLNYKIVLDNYFVYYTNKTSFDIKNFKELNNYKENMNIKIYCDVNNYYYELFNTEIKNYHFIDSPYNFDPVIDYSNALLPDAKTAIIKWTNPQYRHTCKVKVEVDFIKQFLDEYLKPWQQHYMLDKEPFNFDRIYDDYSKELAYDFNEDGQYKYKSVNDSSLTYTSFNKLIDIGENDSLEIPVWFCNNDSSYKITVEIYDRWGKLRGAGKAEFSINSIAQEITDKHIILDRQQYMQFGETGTVGEFYKKINPTPIDVKYAYAPKYKTYLGQALYDFSNTDSNKISLYYYFNSNEQDKNLIVKYKRSYNFYKLTYEILYKDEVIVPVTEHYPQGNTFETNQFSISKSLLQKEGEYLMNIKTFSSTNLESSVKEIKFYVFNDKPEVPVVEINQSDFDMVNDKIVINKKYFSMNVINNKLNKKYAGWNYKEVHFYFRKITSGYNDYPDYVIQASKENGLITFKNTLPIENNNYECKVIAYDYAGNESDPYIFEFELLSKMKVEPELLFTNVLDKPIRWTITKSQDSEGYYRQFKYSSDGINFNYTEPVKVDSPYHVNDPNSNQIDVLELNWLFDDTTQTYKQGLYQLVVYEWNLRHPFGITDCKFESPIVEVNKVSNPSNPINAKAIPKKVAVFNPRAFNEYAYTNDLNNITFETIHNEVVLDNTDSPTIEGQYYKLKLIEPSTKNEYECTLPIPKKIGLYTFDNIATKCNIDNPVEGVWEVRFITIDRAGNSNDYKGYYTYYINLVKRNPEITNIVLNNFNGSEYFGISSNSIGAFVETNCYNDISNFKEHIEKFEINKFKVTFLSTPANLQYTVTLYKNNKNLIELINKLTEEEKINHTKDGRYLITIQAIDSLERLSVGVEKNFFIDTQTDSNLFFVTPDTFYNRNVTLVASSNDDAYKVYYKIVDREEEINPDDYKTWNSTIIGEVTYNDSSFNGCQISNLNFEDDGRKTLAYVIEELSGNITELFYYNFIIDSSIKIAPIFDYSNKVFYTLNDDNISVTWNLSSDNITNYKIKLDKIDVDSAGNVTVIDSYDFSTVKDGLLVPIGPSENHWIDWGSDKSCNFLIKENGFLVNGLYRLSVKSTSKYGDLEVNDFKFQIDTNNMIDLAEMITKNIITIDSNRITWAHLSTALYYEVSYDNKYFYRTFNNYFIIDTEKVLTDKNGSSCIYLRYKNKSGRLSETSKIILNITTHKIEKPYVEFVNGSTVTDDNRVLEWRVEVSDPEVAKFLYYSFDNLNWKVATVKGKTNLILDEGHNSPIVDGEYGIFVLTTDQNPIETNYFSKSPLTYANVKIFAEKIPTPIFLNLKSGEHISEPKQLFISNKIKDVDYYIYVNNKLVHEGYEISSSTLKKFNIKVDAVKKGIDNKIYHLIDAQQDFHIWSLTTSEYTLNINSEKVKCKISDDNFIEIYSMPNVSQKQIILYRDKNSINENYKILRVGDRLSLLTEWEFHITTFEIN